MVRTKEVARWECKPYASPCPVVHKVFPTVTLLDISDPDPPPPPQPIHAEEIESSSIVVVQNPNTNGATLPNPNPNPTSTADLQSQTEPESMTNGPSELTSTVTIETGIEDQIQNNCDYCEVPLVTKFILPIGSDDRKVLCSHKCLTLFKAIILDVFKYVGIFQSKPKYKCAICSKKVETLPCTVSSDQANSFCTLMKLESSTFNFQGLECCEDCEKDLNKVSENILRLNELQHEMKVQRQKFLDCILAERSKESKCMEMSPMAEQFTAVLLQATEEVKRKRLEELRLEQIELEHNTISKNDDLSSQNSSLSEEDSGNAPSQCNDAETITVTATTNESETETEIIETTLNNSNASLITVHELNTDEETNQVSNMPDNPPQNTSDLLTICTTPVKEVRIICEDIVKSKSPLLSKRCHSESDSLSDSDPGIESQKSKPKVKRKPLSPARKLARRSYISPSLTVVKSSSTPIEPPDSPPLKRRLRKRSVSVRSKYNSEVESDDSLSVPIPLPQSDTATCTICSIDFSSQELYKNHCEFLHVTVCCKHCEKEFRNQDSLETHLNEEHLKVNPFSVRFQRQAIPLPQKSLNGKTST